MAAKDVPTSPAAEQAEQSPGLPLLRSWRAVYAFVLGSFVLWVVLLFALWRLFP